MIASHSFPSMRRLSRLMTFTATAVLLVACGGGGGQITIGGGSPDTPQAPLVDRTFDSTSVVKVESGARGYAVLEEHPRALAKQSEEGPDRRIAAWLDEGRASGNYQAGGQWSLIDFALHPSGEMSAVLATQRELKLVRLDARARMLRETPIVDTAAKTDPYVNVGPGRDTHDDDSLLPTFTRDAVRIAANGENLVVGLRTGRHASVAYGYTNSAAGYTRAWRTLVEPGTQMGYTVPTSGSYDTFGQLNNHWEVQVAVDAQGQVGIGVVSNEITGELLAAHAEHFKEPVTTKVGLLVTRLSSTGQRLHTAVIDTKQVTQLHRLRAIRGNFVAVGRVRSEIRSDGTGWNAYIGMVNANGQVAGYQVLDFEQGDVLFDVAELPQNRYLVAGATAYNQNPSGASISESAAPLLAVLEADGRVRERVAVVKGPRHNQLRSLAAHGSYWLTGGMVNGPGTHSGDGNPALISAQGFLRDVKLGNP